MGQREPEHVVQARLIGVKRVYEEAALSLGANRLQAFREITMPLIMPAVLAGLLLAFTISFDNVSASVFLDCGLDFDRWYPFPRRMAAMVKSLLTHRRQRPHVRRTLDTVRERFDVRCGPLLDAGRVSAGPR